MRQAWQLAGRGLLAALAIAVVMSAAIASLILSLPKVWGVGPHVGCFGSAPDNLCAAISFQAHSLDQLRHIFPPRSIPEIAAYRDCLLGVAAESPVGGLGTWDALSELATPGIKHGLGSPACPQSLALCTLQVHIALLFALVYIGMQTFAIPGTISLSLLGGAMFGLWRGLAVVSGVDPCLARFPPGVPTARCGLPSCCLD